MMMDMAPQMITRKKILMIILKKKMITAMLGSILSVFLLVLLASLLAFPQSSNAQTQEIVTGTTTTENLINPDLNTYTRDGNTFLGTGNGCAVGEFCTGGNTIGGTYTTTFDLKDNMTIDNINRGFTLDSGIDVKSHISNVTVPNCITTTQSSPDCKDVFSLTIKLFNADQPGGINLVHTFEHEVTLDFSGARSFSYQDLIPANEFSFLTGEFTLFGIDAGYPAGAFGPSFSNPTMTTTFDIVSIIQDIVIDIIQDEILPEFTAPVTSIEVEINNSTVEASAPMTPVEIAEIQTIELQPPVMETRMETPTVEQVAEVATTESVEQEMEIVNEPTNEQPIEPTVNNGPEPSEEGGTNNETTENEDADNGSTNTRVRREPPTEPDPEETPAEPTSVKKETPKQKVAKKRAAKQKVAKKIMKRMGDKGKYDSTNQIRQLVVMQVLGNTRSFFNVQKIIPDMPGFFNDTKVPDASISDNNYSAYILFGGSDLAHDALTESQYRR